jgi:hypothetical protein
MVIAVLVLNARATSKLAARGIDASEVEQVRRNGPYVPRNPHPRVPGSRLMIGETDGGRTLTVVIQPDADDPSAWHVMTGWRASPRERDTYRTHTRRRR